MAQLDDPGVAPGARREARSQILEQPMRHRAVFEPPLHEAARMQVAASRQRDESLGVGTQFLRLRLRGHDLVVPEEARGHVREHRLLVARRARQLPTLGAVAHYSRSPSVACACGATPGSTTLSSSAASSNFMPKLRPSRRSSSAISPRAFSPTFLTLSRSSSRYCTTSSMERPNTSRKRLVAAPPFPAGWAATMGTLPKSTKKRKCSWASAAA